MQSRDTSVRMIKMPDELFLASGSSVLCLNVAQPTGCSSPPRVCA